jgi:hypothetical protein
MRLNFEIWWIRTVYGYEIEQKKILGKYLYDEKL